MSSLLSSMFSNILVYPSAGKAWKSSLKYLSSLLVLYGRRARTDASSSLGHLSHCFLVYCLNILSYKSVPTREIDISSPFLGGCSSFGLLSSSHAIISSSVLMSVPNRVLTVSILGGMGTILSVSFTSLTCPRTLCL